MSLPKLPDNLTIDRYDAINILIASVGLEELALSHILNAEGEKIQYILGTLEGRDPGEVTICDILQINDSVNKTLRNVMLTEMMLQFKLEEVLALGDEEPERTFNITYYAGNGGEGEPYVDSGILKDSSYTIKTLAETGITPEVGFQFVEWNTALDGTGTSYQPEDIITVTGNITLYGIWSVI